MTLARRLETIEGSLSPTKLVLRWLAEAHAYGSLDAYVGANLEQAPENLAANRLCREAEHAAKAVAGTRDREQLDRAIRKALREVMFRFELVMRMNVTAHELLEKDVYVRAATTSQLALLVGSEAFGDGRHRELVTQLAEVTIVWADRLGAAGLAREMAERRYLDACPVLFPDVRTAWDRQLHEAREVAVMARTLAEIDGADLPSLESAQENLENQAERLLLDLVEPAKVIALDKLGEGHAAIRIATSWYRARAGREEAEMGADSAASALTL